MTIHAKQAAALIKERYPGFIPKVGIICGSGLGVLADALQESVIIPYTELAGFPECSIKGHISNLCLGTLNGLPVVCLQGRAHFYEGIDREVVLTLVRTLKLLGCETLLGTNSSGSLRPEVKPGSIVVTKDHI